MWSSDMFTPRLAPQGFCIVCVIAFTVCPNFARGAAAQKRPAPSEAGVSEASAEAQLRAGLVYERGGRFAEAEAAFSKALQDGSPQTRLTALQALDRVILERESVEGELQLRLGEVFEDEGRLAEAEAAYVKVIESGPPAMRVEALRRIRHAVEQRESLYEKYLVPAGDAIVTALVYIVLVVLVVVICRRPMNAIGQRRGRHALTICAFAHSSGPLTVGATFTDVVEAMHERMALHFQKRTVLRNSTLPALAQSQSAQITEMVAAVSAPAVPFLHWLLKLLYQPAYQLSGSIESTTLHVNVLATLEHSGTTVERWSRSFPMNDWFVGQQDLAYEILLRLKEYVDGHAS